MDEAGFAAAMEKQKSQARAAGKFKMDKALDYTGAGNTFVGYDDESRTSVLELTYNWDTKAYDMGNGYGHVAIEVDDAYKTCEEVKKRGGKVTREPGPMKHGTTVIAFVEDPDGYKIEFVQRKGG